MLTFNLTHRFVWGWQDSSYVLLSVLNKAMYMVNVHLHRARYLTMTTSISILNPCNHILLQSTWLQALSSSKYPPTYHLKIWPDLHTSQAYESALSDYEPVSVYPGLLWWWKASPTPWNSEESSSPSSQSGSAWYSLICHHHTASVLGQYEYRWN